MNTQAILEYVEKHAPKTFSVVGLRKFISSSKTALKGIKITYNKLNDPEFLLRFDSHSGQPHFHNGLVISMPECRVLIVPPPKIVNFENIDRITKMIPVAKVFPVRQGTTVSLWFDGKWRWASKNATDISSAVWRGYQYADILNEFAEIYGLDYDALDTEKIYSIGFEHPAHHYFGQPAIYSDEPLDWRMSAWFVSVQDTKTHTVSLEKPDEIPFPAQIDLLPEIRKVKKSDEAIANYLLHGVKSATFTSGFLGYIVYDDQPVGRIMPTLLMDNIMDCLFDIDKYETNTRISGQTVSSTRFTLLRIILDSHKNQTFFTLMPQFAEIRDNAMAILEKVVDTLYSALNTGDIGSDDIVKNITRELLPTIVNEFKIGTRINGEISETTDKQVLRDLVINRRYENIYWKYPITP